MKIMFSEKEIKAMVGMAEKVGFSIPDTTTQEGQ